MEGKLELLYEASHFVLFWLRFLGQHDNTCTCNLRPKKIRYIEIYTIGYAKENENELIKC